MAENIVVMDTANMVMRRKSDGYTIASTTMQLAGLSGTNAEEELRGGIGNGVIALLRTDKDLTLTARDALWSMDYLAMTQGVEVEGEGAATVTHVEVLNVVDGAFTPTRTPAGDITYVNDGGEQVTVAADAGGAVTAADATGQVQVFYPVDVTGDIVTFDSKRFSEKWEVELYTIGYDPDTMQVIKDIYIQFDDVQPSGDFDMSFEAGTALTPELDLSVLAPRGSTEMGRIIVADHVE